MNFPLHCRRALSIAVTSAAFALTSSASAQNDTDFFLADYMNNVVMSAANVLWESVYPAASANGEESYVGPATDAEWQRVRDAAQTLIDAGPTLKALPANWQVRDPSLEYETPPGELRPEQITALVKTEAQTWSAYADVMSATATQALSAIEQRDLKALFDVTGVLDAPCTSCHTQFWYPNSAQ